MSEGFGRDLNLLSKEDRRHALDAISKLIESPSMHAGGLQMKKMKAFDVYEIRATQSLRIVARREGQDLLCCRVGQHDKTLKAGAAGQLGALPDINRLRVLARETDVELDKESADVPFSALPSDHAWASASVDAGPLARMTDADLRSRFGLPAEWIPAIRSLRTEEQFASQELEGLIPDAAWYELAKLFPPTPIVSTGAAPTYRVPSVDVARAFADGAIEELEFNLPATSWAVVERTRPGPIFVRGGPGSGKSLLGMYRALHALDRPPTLDRPRTRVLYATFTNALADDIREKVRLLRGELPEGLEISTVDRLVERFAPHGLRTTYDKNLIDEAWRIASETESNGRFDEKFLRSEIEDVVVARGLDTIDSYLSVTRTGRTRRLAQADRRIIWAAYERFRLWLSERGVRTLGLARMAAFKAVGSADESERYDLVVLDEVQDLTAPALGVVIGLARGSGSGRDVTLIGDGGQSIYRAGFKWADVNLRLGGGNVVTLATCERSSPAIVRFAAALSGRQSDDHDEDINDLRAGDDGRSNKPRIRQHFSDREDQRAWLVHDLRRRLVEIPPRRIAIIARALSELERVEEQLTRAKIPYVDYRDATFHRRDAVRCITPQSAKGLEFGEVYIIGADDGSFPLVYDDLSQDERAEKIGIDARLLYVAVTRAKQRLTIICGTRPSPFLGPAFSFADVESAE